MNITVKITRSKWLLLLGTHWQKKLISWINKLFVNSWKGCSASLLEFLALFFQNFVNNINTWQPNVCKYQVKLKKQGCILSLELHYFELLVIFFFFCRVFRLNILIVCKQISSLSFYLNTGLALWVPKLWFTKVLSTRWNCKESIN